MTTVESMFNEAKCASCLRVLPIERVHLFRRGEQPHKTESLTFCSKDCEIDFSMKGVADLAKAFLLSRNEINEGSIKVIEKKYPIIKQKVIGENRKAKTIRCARCGHTWLTTSNHKMVSCPSCLGKTPNNMK
jgi:formylmethanofuran dehydrogenase subunit E